MIGGNDIQKRLIKSISIYSLLGILPTASRIVLLPIYLIYLSPRDFAIIGLNTTIIGAVSIFMSFGLDQAYSKFFFNYKRNQRVLNSYYSTIIISIFIISLILIAILLPFGTRIHQFIFKDPNFIFFPYGITALITAAIISINSVLLINYRNKHEATNFLYLAGGYFFVSTISEFIAIIGFNCNAAQIIIAKLVTTGIFSFIIWLLTVKKTGLTFDFRFLKPSIKFSLPLIPYTIFYFIYTGYDRIIIENKLTLNLLAVYNCAFAIAAVSEIAFLSIGNAVSPEIYECYKNGPKLFENRISKIYRSYGLAILGTAGILCFFTPIAILGLLKENYIEAIQLVPILLVSFNLRYLLSIYTDVLFFFNKTSRLPYLNAFAGVITIIMNLILLPVYGIIGAAISTLITRFGQVLLAYLLSKNFITFRINLDYITTLFISSSLIMLILPLCNYLFQFRYLTLVTYSIPLFLFLAVFYNKQLKHISFKQLLVAFKSISK